MNPSRSHFQRFWEVCGVLCVLGLPFSAFSAPAPQVRSGASSSAQKTGVSSSNTAKEASSKRDSSSKKNTEKKTQTGPRSVVDAIQNAARRAERRRKRRKRRRRKRSVKKEQPMVKRGIYDRPYLYRYGSAIALGGYVDLAANYMQEEGITDGFSFEARRFNLFVFSSISRFVRLTAELEFEHGTAEIALETALVDIRLHSMLNIRGGILLPPLGRFNISHDSPIYDLVDRPLVSKQIIPSTYSDVGGGLYGVFHFGRSHQLTYEIYVVNGLTAGIVSGSSDGTRIANGKSASLFEEDNNGVPAVTGRLGYTMPFGVEVGLSGYAGIYNQPKKDGEEVGTARWLKLLVVDAEFSKGPLTIRGEAAWAWIDVPENLKPIYATFQWGFYTDISLRIWKGRVLMLRNASLTVVTRIDYIDLHVGQRNGKNIGDETVRLSVGLSFRPAPQTSLRLLYQHNWMTDSFDNPSRKGGVQLGLATYF